MYLEVNNVAISFGGLKALEDCYLIVEEKTIVGIIGPNGAGKTTLLNVISGFYRQDSGDVIFRGHNINKLPPFKRALLGIVTTFQIPRELFKLTALETLLLSRREQKGENILNLLFRMKAVRSEEAENYSKAMETLKFLHLDHLANSYSMNLSTGQKKLLELGRALMVDAELLLLDEPFAGVHPELMEDIMRVIRELRDKGKTFVVVEHNIDAITRLCEVIHFMHDGKCLCSGKPQQIVRDERVINAYIGG